MTDAQCHQEELEVERKTTHSTSDKLQSVTFFLNNLFFSSYYPSVTRIIPNNPKQINQLYFDNIAKLKSIASLNSLKVSPKDFEKVKIIGKGSVGKVYLVKKKCDQSLYAMKVLSKSEMIQRNKVKRVLAEQEILTLSKHPFIVTLYDSFQTESNIYFILEYCAGGEFFRTLNKRGHLKEWEAKFYAAEVISALEYLHLHGFIYRDLKTENVLLHQTGHIMLADFDLSKFNNLVPYPVLEKTHFKSYFGEKDFYYLDTHSSCNIKTRSFVGTEEYMAPEIILDLGHTSSVDWWSLGIFIFEMLFGKTPFLGKDNDETFDNILKKEVKFLNNIQHVSSKVKNLITSLLIKDQDLRLGSQFGASQVKLHPFFKGIKWDLLRNMTPPIIPVLKDRLDTSNFYRYNDNGPNSLNLENECCVSQKCSSFTSNTVVADSTADGSELFDDPFVDFESVSIHGD
ncbi:hypothetical protein HDU92_007630 [Lobulomyces angularis]|nr:hypothetical protein HDU92_007630 [Lobulomyces angularis]